MKKGDITSGELQESEMATDDELQVVRDTLKDVGDGFTAFAPWIVRRLVARLDSAEATVVRQKETADALVQQIDEFYQP